MDVESVVDYLAENYFSYARETGSNSLKCRCPFHSGGNERRPSFVITRDNGLWFCHTCQEGGHLKGLLKRLGIRNIELTGLPRPRKREETKPDELPIGLLSIFNRCPKSLLRVGFKKSVLRKHWIGFDSRAEYKRITFPILCAKGRLRGISGRVREGSMDDRKYKFYTHKDFSGLIFSDKYTFKRRQYLWRENLVEPKKPIFVNEGFKAAMWLAQYDYNSVALMGTYASDEQMRKLRKLDPPILYLFLDNDEWGVKGTVKLIPRLLGAGLLNIRVCRYPEGAEEPDALDCDELERAISNAYNIGEFLTKV